MAAAALAAALASGAFDQVAPLCDAAELEARLQLRCAPPGSAWLG